MSRGQYLERLTTHPGSDLRRLEIVHNLLVPDVNVTAVGNVTSGEDDLMTYTLPADTFAQAGDAVIIEAWGTVANDADTKTLKGYIGNDAFLNIALTASVAGKWHVRAVLARSGADTQDTVAVLTEGVATLAAITGTIQNGTADQDEDAAIVVKFTGTSDGDDTDDIVQEGMIVWLPSRVIANQAGTVLTNLQY